MQSVFWLVHCCLRIWRNIFPYGFLCSSLNQHLTWSWMRSLLFWVSLQRFSWFKKVAAWYLWILVDIIGIWLYWVKWVKFISAEYVLFLILATNGLIQRLHIYHKNNKKPIQLLIHPLALFLKRYTHGQNTAPNFTIESLLDDLEQFRWIDTLKAEFKEIDAAKQAIDKIKSLNLPQNRKHLYRSVSANYSEKCRDYKQ